MSDAIDRGVDKPGEVAPNGTEPGSVHPDGVAPCGAARGAADQRGVGLVEAMIALLVLAFGLLGIARLQAVLRTHADAAAQRATAMRLAQAEIEALRAAPGEIAGAGNITSNVDADPAVTYTLERQLAPLAGGRADALTLVVRWHDRAGATQQAVLSTIVSHADPALAAALPAPRP